jgi:hypothetical protein
MHRMPLWKQNRTRAIVTPASDARTSNSPFPIGLPSGMPIGQRNWTRCKSCPISRRLAGGKPSSQSRTGTLPASV